jgi:hypothetical protein
MNAPRPLPDQAVLRSLLDYSASTGELRWRERPAEMFDADWCRRKWNTRYAGELALWGTDSEGYRAGSIFHRKRRAHRVIWKWMTGLDPDTIDHINGDRTDNIWTNLRSIRESENNRNLSIPRGNKSGVAGVRFNKKTRRWVAYIQNDGKQVHLGGFSAIEEAVSARRSAECEFGYHAYHGRSAV